MKQHSTAQCILESVWCKKCSLMHCVRSIKLHTAPYNRT